MVWPDLLRLGAGLAVLGLLFTVVEAAFRSAPKPAWYRRADFRTDLAYWFFSPIVSGVLARLAVGLAIFGVVWLSGGSLAALHADAVAGRLPTLGWAWAAERLGALPFAVQVFLGLVVSDAISYWVHRAFHLRPLWSLHAVHHSSPRLDWLSSVRLHPLNQAVMRVLEAVPLFFLGFDPAVFAVVAPFFTFYSILLHANVGWDLGPLRYLVTSPRFHRWHHSADAAQREKNFAVLFPVWDLLFGTFHMPRNEVPMAFGAGDEPVPAGLWRQVAYPFRRPRAGERLAADVL